MVTLQIGIAGAGIGGLAAAAALARGGHRVVVFDRFEAPEPVGSGLVIQPVGQAVLDAIGAGAAARGLGRRITRMLGHEAARGGVVLDVAYDPGGTGARYGLALHRAALFHAVLEAARAAGAELVPGHAVKGVTEAGKRRLMFANGRQSAPFDLVIDAAGAGSPLSPLTARALPYGAIWGTVDWPEGASLPDDRLSQRYHRASRMAGVLPIGRLPGNGADKTAIFWSLNRADIAAWQAAPVAAWRAEATALWHDFAPFLDQITDHAQMTPAFYSHGTLSRPAAPGLVHIGDAAHRASPQLGQGANMALLDAWALARAVAAADDMADALRRYTRARRRHLRVYQAMSAAFTPLYQSDSRVLPVLRDRVLAPLSRVPPMPGLLARLVCGDLVPPLQERPLRRISGP